MVKILNALFTGTLLLLSFLIFINPQKTNIRANKWFCLFVFCLFLISFETLLGDLNVKIENQFVDILINLSNFSIAPIFYLSVCYFIEPARRWKRISFFHFSFPLLLILLQIVTLFVVEQSDEVSPKVQTLATIIFFIVFGSQVLIYCILAYRKLLKHQKNIPFFSSSTEKINLKWLQYICIGIITIATFWVFDIIFQISEKNYYFDVFSSALYFFSSFFIAFYWLRQTEIFPYSQIQISEIKEIITETHLHQENRKKLLSDEKLETCKNELIALMSTTKPYLDCELTLVKLASQMKISAHVLSYIINNGFNENFYQFINRHRIEEAKKLIANPQMNHLNLIGISYEVGFNSKTVFNTTFKKHTGKTPTEFKKTINTEA